MQEKELEARFRERVKAAGGRAYKFVSPGNSGVPDRLVVLPGGTHRFCGAEAAGKEADKAAGTAA